MTQIKVCEMSRLVCGDGYLDSMQEYESIYKASLAIAAFPPQQRVVSRRKREDDDEDEDEMERYALFSDPPQYH